MNAIAGVIVVPEVGCSSLLVAPPCGCGITPRWIEVSTTVVWALHQIRDFGCGFALVPKMLIAAFSESWDKQALDLRSVWSGTSLIGLLLRQVVGQ